MNQTNRYGLTPIECLVAMFIIVILILLLMPNVEQPRGDARRAQCKINLKQIMLALHNYHDVYDSFPPVYVADVNGKPLHSWRVLILPFIDQKYLYEKYDFSEPWNGPNNSQLVAEYPDLPIYTCPEQMESGISYMAVVGEGTMWPGAECVSLRDVKDGTSNTISIVEVTGMTSHWIEPIDLNFDELPMQLNPENGFGISSKHLGGVNVGMADGSVKILKPDTDATTLKHLLLRADEADKWDSF